MAPIRIEAQTQDRKKKKNLNQIMINTNWCSRQQSCQRTKIQNTKTHKQIQRKGKCLLLAEKPKYKVTTQCETCGGPDMEKVLKGLLTTTNNTQITVGIYNKLVYQDDVQL